MGAEMGSEPKFGRGSDTVKIVFLCAVLAIALGFIVNALGIVDFGKLLGFSEPTEKQSPETLVAKKLPTTETPTQKQSSETRVAKKLPIREPAPVAAKAPRETATPSTPEQSTAQTVWPSQKPRETTTPYAHPTPPAPSEQKRAAAQKPATTPPSTQTPVVARTSPAPAAPTAKRETAAGEELFPEEKISPRPYSVYLGSYKTVERAEKAISEYRDRGIRAYRVKVDLGEKGVWHRIFIGYFRDKKEAATFIAKKGLAEGEVKKTRYATLIGVYTSEGGARKTSQNLSRLGYSPYVIETKRGDSQLYVGAFYTRAGAEKLRTDLAAKGIQSRVVER
jgi:cell division septation protein DedD